MIEFIQHNHKETGRAADCPACSAGMPDQVNHNVPDVCAYEWIYTPIDDIRSCVRHGLGVPHGVTSDDYINYDGPCMARKCEGEFADYIHIPTTRSKDETYLQRLTELNRGRAEIEFMMGHVLDEYR